MKKLAASCTRLVSAEPPGVSREARHPVTGGPPVGRAFLAFTAALLVTLVVALQQVGAAGRPASAAAAHLGVVASTVFGLAGLVAIYRAATTRAPALTPIVVVLLGPGALWCWLVFVAGTATGPVTATVVVVSSALVGVALLAEGLRRARWLGVFCGLGAVAISLAASVVRFRPEATTTPSLALLVALAGMTCLYGSLAEIEASERRSLKQLLEAKTQIEREIALTEELLHDLRSGLLSIEAAIGSIDSEMAGPLRSEAARLRRLTLKGERTPVEFDIVPGLRNMARARRAGGVSVDLRAPTTAWVLGEESEVMAVVDNLLSNAQRHGAGPIQLEVNEHSGMIKVSVSDRGSIDDPGPDAIFRRGYSSHRDGSGIGLSRARMLALLNLGDLSYEPLPEGGTSFVFTLPSAQATLGAEPFSPAP